MKYSVAKRFMATSLVAISLITTGCSIPKPIENVLPKSFTSIFSDEEIVVADKDETNSYMYKTLTSDQQILYDKLVVAFENFTSEIETNVENDEIETVYEAIMADRPELFYVSGYVIDGTVIYPNYMYTQDEVTEYMNQIDSITNKWLKGIDLNIASQYDISKYCFEQIIENVKYVKESETNQDLVDAVILGEGVSSSYTAAYVYMMQKCGITSIAAKGILAEEEHTWAVSIIDSQTYATDVMNGDYNYIDTNGNDVYMTDYCCLNMIPAAAKNYSPYTLFANIKYESTDANYFAKNDILLAGYDENKIKEIIETELAAGNNVIKLAFTSQAAMDTALFQLRDAGRLSLMCDNTQAGFLNSKQFYSITIIF